jgi:gas vesicle protein
MMSEGDGRGFVAGFISGAFVGLVVAFLLTPKSGEEMRKSISEYARKGQENLLKQKEKLEENITNLASKIADSTKDLLERGKEVVESKKKKRD